MEWLLLLALFLLDCVNFVFDACAVGQQQQHTISLVIQLEHGRQRGDRRVCPTRGLSAIPFDARLTLFFSKFCLNEADFTFCWFICFFMTILKNGIKFHLLMYLFILGSGTQFMAAGFYNLILTDGRTDGISFFSSYINFFFCPLLS